VNLRELLAWLARVLEACLGLSPGVLRQERCASECYNPCARNLLANVIAAY
jgi:hypothetical protein